MSNKPNDNILSIEEIDQLLHEAYYNVDMYIKLKMDSNFRNACKGEGVSIVSKIIRQMYDHYRFIQDFVGFPKHCHPCIRSTAGVKELELELELEEFDYPDNVMLTYQEFKQYFHQLFHTRLQLQPEYRKNYSNVDLDGLLSCLTPETAFFLEDLYQWSIKEYDYEFRDS